MKLAQVAQEIFEYLIGFIALAVFAAYAFANGQPTEARWLSAFKLGAAVSLLELSYLWFRARPANRLILGGNIWLCAGGIAVYFEQWWWLKLYERFGEASLIAAMFCIGVFSTVFSRAGFVGEIGTRRAVRSASLILLGAVAFALCFAMLNKGNAKFAAIVPIIALAWLNRALRVWTRRAV